MPKRGEVLTDLERSAVVRALMHWIIRHNEKDRAEEPQFRSALRKVAGVDKRVSVTTSTGGTYGDARAGGSGSDAG